MSDNIAPLHSSVKESVQLLLHELSPFLLDSHGTRRIYRNFHPFLFSALLSISTSQLRVRSTTALLHLEVSQSQTVAISLLCLVRMRRLSLFPVAQ